MKKQLAPQRGFTLLEMLVAFSIMAISLAMIYRIMASDARAANSMAKAQGASIVAESLLSLNDFVPPEGWNQSGQSGDFSWQVSSSIFLPSEFNTPAMHEIQIQISWSEGSKQRVLELSTLRAERKLVVEGGRR